MIWLITFHLWAPLALLVDIILAHSLFALYLRYRPLRGEWTFSQVLARLIERGDWTGEVARYLKRVLDAIAPSGIHIKPR